MRRSIATVNIEVRSESSESLHYLVDTIVERLNKKPPGVRFEDVGTAQLVKARVSRVRPVRRAK